MMARTRVAGVLILVGVVLLAGASFVRKALAGEDEPRATAPVAKVAETAVVRTNLSDFWSEPGTIGFSRQRMLKGASDGLITWLPKSGSTMSRGDALFRVDDRPVTLFYGGTPMFRDIDTVGLVGRDVRVLADNLRTLGYTIGEQPAVGTVVQVGKGGKLGKASAQTYQARVTAGDGVFTEALRAAVKRWQWNTGVRPADGVVKLGDLAVLPGKVRIGATAAKLGDPASADVMAVSDQKKAVSVEISAGRATDVRSGQKVRITLPDSSVTGGIVRSVSTKVQSQQSDGDDDEPMVQVVVSVTKPSALRGITSGDVDVRFTGTTRRHVLAVPVGALLALSGGGYGLQISGGALTAVKVGLFADGLVQVSGDGVEEGVKVVTTS
jgi:peptidoglycan hydrolase-like protein with peptidoglycan-binding domain